MLKGLNSDIFSNGLSYHVQTEDWGQDRAYILSRVFCGGAVIKTVKNEYSKIHADVRRAMQTQHDKILDLIHSGQIS